MPAKESFHCNKFDESVQWLAGFALRVSLLLIRRVFSLSFFFVYLCTLVICVISSDLCFHKRSPCLFPEELVAKEMEDTARAEEDEEVEVEDEAETDAEMDEGEEVICVFTREVPPFCQKKEQQWKEMMDEAAASQQ